VLEASMCETAEGSHRGSRTDRECHPDAPKVTLWETTQLYVSRPGAVRWFPHTPSAPISGANGSSTGGNACLPRSLLTGVSMLSRAAFLPPNAVHCAVEVLSDPMTSPPRAMHSPPLKVCWVPMVVRPCEPLRRSVQVEDQVAETDDPGAGLGAVIRGHSRTKPLALEPSAGPSRRSCPFVGGEYSSEA